MTSPRGGTDRWLVSYADFITLLFAFFTTLYAISNVDTAKLEPVASSLQKAFAANPVEAAASGRPTLVAPVEVLTREQTLAAVRAHISRELSGAIASGRLEVAEDPRGLVLSLPDEATFRIGSADVTGEARDLIGRIAGTLLPLENGIRVEGHTDDVPIRTARYSSNWELSTARASAVVAFLIESKLAPQRLSAAGYGEFHPRGPNDSAAARARNRRVDIVVITPARAVEEPGGVEAAQ